MHLQSLDRTGSNSTLLAPWPTPGQSPEACPWVFGHQPFFFSGLCFEHFYMMRHKNPNSVMHGSKEFVNVMLFTVLKFEKNFERIS